MGTSGWLGWLELSAVARLARLPRRFATRNNSRRSTRGSGDGNGVRGQEPVPGLLGGVGEPLAHDGLAALGDLDAEAIGETVHEIEHAGDGDSGQDLLVGEADSAEGIDVGFGHRCRGQGELDGVVEDGPGLGVQVCPRVVVDDVAGVFGVAGVLTEEPSVGDGSIPAAVDQGDHRGDGLLLGAGEGG